MKQHQARFLNFHMVSYEASPASNSIGIWLRSIQFDGMPCLFVYNLTIIHNSVELRSSVRTLSRNLALSAISNSNFFLLKYAFQSFNICDIEVRSVYIYFKSFLGFVEISRWRGAVLSRMPVAWRPWPKWASRVYHNVLLQLPSHFFVSFFFYLLV